MLFGVDDPPQLLGNRLGADGPELVHLRAREHGVGDLVELGRRHHEHDVGRRLLDRFEQRVERRHGQLMDFVDDEDLVAVANRHDGEAGDDHVADVVDAGVGRGVDLQDVDVAPFGDLDACVARPHGSGVGPLTQFNARARIRAVVVLPTPRGPANTNACARRPLDSALRSVRVTACCPTTSSNRCGRHLRAMNLVGHRRFQIAG